MKDSAFFRWMAALALLNIFCSWTMSVALGAERKPTVDFLNDIVPLLTKHGCNAGACHGAAIGRGGFQLSLYGGDPVRDQEAMARRDRGRRVNLANASKSLVVLKPTEHVEHGGGTLFDMESESASLLTRWIDEGARYTVGRRLQRLEFTPRKYIAQGVGERVPLTATAFYDDGSRRDVTRWTMFVPDDSTAVAIEPEPAVAHIKRRGRHVVLARYLDRVAPIEIMAPLANSPVDHSRAPRANFIDDQVLDVLSVLRLPLSAPVGDEAFLRRVSFDLTGHLPDEVQRRDFLKDTRADKREILVDALLRSKAFTEYWTYQLAKWLRIRPGGHDEEGAKVYHRWLESQVAGEFDYQIFARSLLTASGDAHRVGPANYYRTTAGAREQAEFTSELFMGSRLRCANCHNHPLDRWTQDDYHGLAAIFARVERGRVIRSNPAGEVIHPRTLEPARLRIPGNQFLEEEEEARIQLADWLATAENPYFAKAMVNRLWKQLMGRGLVEPVDDFRDSNPPTHPELLGLLAADFVENGFRLRHTLRRIATSHTYARTADAEAENRHDDRFYSRALRRPLAAEVLADAMDDVLGVPSSYAGNPEGTRAVQLIDPRTPSTTLDILGRCSREIGCDQSEVGGGGLPQQLHMLNGPLLNGRIGAVDSRLAKLVAKGRPPLEIIRTFYAVGFSRAMSDEEAEFWRAKLTDLPSAAAERELLEDFVWSLLTSDEFVTNH